MDIPECAVCLTTNIIPTNKCITQCNHKFCKNCLDTWFDKGKNTCPMCRQALQYFNHNGANTRIISIERNRIRPTQPININNAPRVTLTRGLYTLLIFSNMGLFISTGFGIFWYSYYCV